MREAEGGGVRWGGSFGLHPHVGHGGGEGGRQGAAASPGRLCMLSSCIPTKRQEALLPRNPRVLLLISGTLQAHLGLGRALPEAV